MRVEEMLENLGLPKFKTRRGERVRSKFELAFANNLFENNIDYVYEPSVDLPEQNDFLVDFFIPKLQHYIELWGNMDSRYQSNKMRKLALFKKYNLSVLGIDYQIYRREGIKHILRNLGLMPKKVISIKENNSKFRRSKKKSKKVLPFNKNPNVRKLVELYGNILREKPP